jgi:succinoglycan biosynthesis transport protein ExoP
MDGSTAEPREVGGVRVGAYGAMAPLGDTAGREQLSFAETLAILRRRRSVILATVTLITLITTFIVYQITPVYTSDATVLLDTRKTDVVDLKSVISALQPEAMQIRSEVDVLRSRQLAEKVLDKLGLEGNAIFTKGVLPLNPSPVAFLPESWQEPFERQLIAFGLETPPPPPTAETAQREREITRNLLMNKLVDHLTVSTDGKSYTIHLSYDSPAALLSTQIVNAIAETYLVDQLEAKFEATKRANSWLSDRLRELKGQVEATETAVAQFRQAHNLSTSDVKGTTVTTQQLGELNSQLILASADRAQKEARLHEFQDAVKRGQGGAAASEVLNSPLINQLRTQEAEVLRKEADLSSRFGERYPALVQARQEHHDLQTKINEEVNKITGALAQDVAVARGREASIRQGLQDITHKAGQNDDAMVKLNELQREADANRALYENFLNRFKETSNQQEILTPDARIIAAADVPTKPSFPSKKLFVLLALIASTLLGVSLAILIERLDDGFRSPAQIEKLTGLSGLGMIPVVSGLSRLGYPVEEFLLRKPTSAFAESIRSIRTSVLYSHVDKPPKVLLVTSAVPEEGKSLLSLSIARTAAKAGQKVLLVDCDLRRPRITAYLKGKAESALADLFAGVKTAEEVLSLDEKSGLQFICARTGMPNPQDLLGSHHMREFLRSAAQHYDLVVLDSPPVMAASDSLVLARLVDATVFVVRWETTPRQVVLNALRQIQSVGGRVAGVVLSRVNVNKNRAFNFGDQSYYYGKYKNYSS